MSLTRRMCQGIVPLAALLLSVLSNLSASAQTTPPAPAWMQKVIEIEADNASLAMLIAGFADATGQSVLVEGKPRDKVFHLEMKDTADKTLTAISRQFGYDWSLSRSGVILLHKRFEDRQDMPEFSIPELKAVADDICDAIRAVYPSADAKLTIHKLFPILTNSLTPAQMQSLAQGKFLKISELTQEQQGAAAQIVYNYLLQKPFDYSQLLHDSLQALPTASVFQRTEQGYISNGQLRDYVVTCLYVPQKDGTDWGAELHRRLKDAEPEKSDSAPHPPASLQTPAVIIRPEPPARQAADISLGLCTLEHAIGVLQKRGGGKIILSPALADRHVIVEVRNATGPQALAGLAELHDLALTKLDTGKYALMRRNYLRPHKVPELGAIIKVVLPADLRRFLLTRPERDPNSFIMDPNVPAYNSYFTSRHIRAKLEALLQAEAEQLYKSLMRDKIGETHVFYSALSPQQREQCVRFLALNAYTQIVYQITPLLDKMTTYEENPAGAYLRYESPAPKSDVGFIDIGGEIKPDQQGGEFGIPFQMKPFGTPATPQLLPTP